MTTNAEKNYVVAKWMGHDVELIPACRGTENYDICVICTNSTSMINYEIESNDAQAMEILKALKLCVTYLDTVEEYLVQWYGEQRSKKWPINCAGKNLNECILHVAYECFQNGGTVG